VVGSGVGGDGCVEGCATEEAGGDGGEGGVEGAGIEGGSGVGSNVKGRRLDVQPRDVEPARRRVHVRGDGGDVGDGGVTRCEGLGEGGDVGRCGGGGTVRHGVGDKPVRNVAEAVASIDVLGAHGGGEGTQGVQDVVDAQHGRVVRLQFVAAVPVERRQPRADEAVGALGLRAQRREGRRHFGLGDGEGRPGDLRRGEEGEGCNEGCGTVHEGSVTVEVLEERLAGRGDGDGNEGVGSVVDERDRGGCGTSSSATVLGEGCWLH
jgi:hypothetical protein